MYTPNRPLQHPIKECGLIVAEQEESIYWVLLLVENRISWKISQRVNIDQDIIVFKHFSRYKLCIFHDLSVKWREMCLLQGNKRTCFGFNTWPHWRKRKLRRGLHLVDTIRSCFLDSRFDFKNKLSYALFWWIKAYKFNASLFLVTQLCMTLIGFIGILRVLIFFTSFLRTLL